MIFARKVASTDNFLEKFIELEAERRFRRIVGHRVHCLWGKQCHQNENESLKFHQLNFHQSFLPSKCLLLQTVEGQLIMSQPSVNSSSKYRSINLPGFGRANIDHEKTWDDLSHAIDEIYSRNASALAFETVYGYGYRLVINKHVSFITIHYATLSC